MPYYIYKGRDQTGQLVQGRLEAESERQAIEDLTRRGVYIISLVSESEGAIEIKETKVKLKDLLQFCRRLSDLLSAGLPLLRALDILRRQFSRNKFGKIVDDLFSQLRGGNPLSKTLNSFPNLPSILPALVSSGEASGNLAYALSEAGNIFEKEMDLRSRIKAALFYPCLVLILGLLTVGFLLSFVVPKIVEIFLDMGQNLPFITRLVIGISSVFVRLWWVLLLIFFVSVFEFRKALQKGKGKEIWEEFKLRIPLIRKIITFREFTLFNRTLGTLIKAGVPLVLGIEYTKSVLRLEKYKKYMDKVKEDIKEGKALSESLEGLFPAEVVDIIAVGEESGNLERSLLNLAESYEKELDYTLKFATQLLEPLLILFVGGIVGIIILAVLLPIFQLNILIR